MDASRSGKVVVGAGQWVSRSTAGPKATLMFRHSPPVMSCRQSIYSIRLTSAVAAAARMFASVLHRDHGVVDSTAAVVLQKCPFRGHPVWPWGIVQASSMQCRAYLHNYILAACLRQCRDTHRVAGHTALTG